MAVTTRFAGEPLTERRSYSEIPTTLYHEDTLKAQRSGQSYTTIRQAPVTESQINSLYEL